MTSLITGIISVLTLGALVIRAKLKKSVKINVSDYLKKIENCQNLSDLEDITTNIKNEL